MKLGPPAFSIALRVVDSHYTLHDLYSTLTKVDCVDPEIVEQHMNEGLRELARQGLIQWTFEPNYGNEPYQRPYRFDEQALQQHWDRCLSVNRLHCGVPDADSPTMLIMGTESLQNLFETDQVESSPPQPADPQPPAA
jgi:hypothetical protein